LFQPADASADNPAPMILHSHGWGGSRSTSGFTAWLDEGFGVLSFDQRGFGQSGRQGGQFNATANVQDPDFEARDVVALIDMVAGLDWVAKDGLNDPVLGAIGGSYGGGYQWVTALYETETTGTTRFNAIAPEISWYDLPDSLAPSGVVRSAWVTALYAAGSYALPEYVHQAFAFGATTGQWPDGTVNDLGFPEEVVPNLDAEFHEHGPVGFVDRGVQLDVPALIRQGASDNLFNLNQGLHNFSKTLTDAARADSLFVGFNGGHALPNVLPMGSASGADPCSDASTSGGWEPLTRDFYRAAFSGGDTTALLPATYNLATMDGDCVSFDATDELEVDLPGSMVATTTGAGAPQHLEIAQGPLTVTGIPTLDADVTSLVADQRVFLALSVGTNPLDAVEVGEQVVDVLDADRQPQQVVGDLEVGPGDRRVGHHARVLDEALDAAERLGEEEQLGRSATPAGHPRRRPRGTTPSRRTAHLPPRRARGPGGRAGRGSAPRRPGRSAASNFGDPCALAQWRSIRTPSVLMPAQGQPVVERARDGPDGVLQEREVGRRRGVGADRAADDVGVPAEVLGGRVHDDVGAERAGCCR
jgi:ABC-2 type transport system ATP-binding protein